VPQERCFDLQFYWAPTCGRYKNGAQSCQEGSDLEALANDVLWTSATIVCAGNEAHQRFLQRVLSIAQSNPSALAFARAPSLIAGKEPPARVDSRQCLHAQHIEGIGDRFFDYSNYCLCGLAMRINVFCNSCFLTNYSPTVGNAFKLNGSGGVGDRFFDHYNYCLGSTMQHRSSARRRQTPNVVNIISRGYNPRKRAGSHATITG
jgi:hypothetical protein